jgi:hypothetical protein
MEPLLPFFQVLESKSIVNLEHKQSLLWHTCHILCKKSKGYPKSKKIFNYEMSLVYGKSLGWSSIKMQHIISSIKI